MSNWAANDENSDVVLKILLIGDSGAGKSSILLRFTDDEFQDDQTVTIGVDFKTKTIKSQNRTVTLTLWDTAGQEKFRSLTSSYYRGTHGIILVYDVSSAASFKSLNSWLSEINQYSTNPAPVLLLVGNKIDKPKREVSREDGLAFAKEHRMLFIECSAKTKLGIQQTFDELVEKILETTELWKKEEKPTKGFQASAPSGPPETSGCSTWC